MKYLKTAALACLLAPALSSYARADFCGNGQAGDTDFKLYSALMSLETGFGASGFSTADADFDGHPELIFGSGLGTNTSIVVLEYDADAGDYALRCQSRKFSSSIIRIAPFHNGTVSQGTLIAFSDGTVKVLDHVTGEFAGSVASGVTPTDILVADVDNDGAQDIAVLSSSQIKVFNAESFSYEHSYAYGGKRFAAGQFTDTSGIELAINTGYVLQADGATASVLWDYSSIGFSDFLLKAGDIDGDGLDEIVGADSWYNMRAFDADTGGVKWDHATDHDIDALTVQDTNGDSVPEVIYGDGQWGSIYILDGATGSVSSSIGNPDHGVTDILIANLDPDTKPELIWGAGYSSSGPDYLHITDVDKSTVDWTSGDSTSGPYYAVAYGKLNGDDIPDRIYASFESESGYADGILTAVDGATDTVLWKTNGNTFGGYAWTGVHDVAIADIDNDGVSEVMVATDKLYDGVVYFLSPEDGSVTGSVKLERGSPIYSLRVANIDSDDNLEVLAGGGKEHTGASGVYVYVIDGATRTWDATLPMLGNSWPDLWSMETLDIDGDTHNEVVALWTKAYVIDPDTNGIVATTGSYTALASTIDIDTGDAVAYVADATGGLYRLGADASVTSVANLCAGQVDALEAVSPATLAFTCKGDLGLYDVLADSVSWQTTGGLDPYLGRYDRLAYQSVDGVNTLLVGGVRAYYFKQGDAAASGPLPTAAAASYEVHFNSVLHGTLSASDPDGAPLHFAIYHPPQKGTAVFTDAGAGLFDYTPPGDFVGDQQFDFLVSNGTTISAPATVTLKLTDTAPTAACIDRSLHWNGDYAGVLAGADEDGDTLTYELVSAPAAGSLDLQADGSFSFSNRSAAVDDVSFSYRVGDGLMWSPDCSVKLTLTNTVPRAPDLTITAYYKIDVATKLLAEDPDGDDLAYELVDSPDRGSASLSPEGLFTYQPDGDKDYSTTLTYRVSDGKETSTTGTVTMKVVGDRVVEVEVSKDSGGGALWFAPLLLLAGRRRRA